MSQSLVDHSELVERLYETSVDPVRLTALIEAWDRRLATADPGGSVRLDLFGTDSFVRHVERAFDVLQKLNAAEFERTDEALDSLRSAAMVLTGLGVVVAANAPAQSVFGLSPMSDIRMLPYAEADVAELVERVAAVSQSGLDEIVQLRRAGVERSVVVHLKPIGGGRSARQVLAVSGEHVWSDEVTEVLQRAFRLTRAEVAVLRRLTAGETVADIAGALGRREGTIRTQVHTLLRKTSTRTQAELVRVEVLRKSVCT